jgi:UPF0755 protein
MRKIILLFIVVLLAGGAYVAYLTLTPYGPSREVFVDIPPGTGTRKIAEMLVNAGVIRSESGFLAVRALNQGAKLQAGEYSFDHPLSVWDVFRKIARGEVHYYELVVPEGSNMFDIATGLGQLGLARPAEFLKVASRPDLIRDLAPNAPTLEGYLFPATYRVTRHTTVAQVAREMTNRFRRAWSELGAPSADVNSIVTLASLVEKESAVPAERPMVAAVYTNRLRMGMKLDCDPTTIYAALLEDRYRGAIHQSDLASTNRYNTYKNAGLPPGPIANPGADALKAALRPADTPFLFFVAKPGGSGSHQFSTTLAEHNVAVQAYRRAQR